MFDCTGTNKNQSCTTASDCNHLNWKQEKAATCIEPVEVFRLDDYSFDKLTSTVLFLSTHTTAIVRLRRSSDNAEKDFYPDPLGNNELTMASEDGAGTSLSTWVGVFSAFMVTQYDQTGNAKDDNQAAAAEQWTVVNSGTLVTLNGIAAADGDAGADVAMTFPATTMETMYMVNQVITQTTINYVLTDAGGAGVYSNGSFAGVNGWGIFDGSALSIAGEDLNQQLGYINTDGVDWFAAKNGAAATNIGAKATNFSMVNLGGRASGGLVMRGVMQFVAIQSSDGSADKAAIEAIINGVFGVY